MASTTSFTRSFTPNRSKRPRIRASPGGGRVADHAPTAPVHGVQVLAVHPHDPGAFTQGLDWDNGALYEGTGEPPEAPSSPSCLEARPGTPPELDDLNQIPPGWEDQA